MKTAVVLLLAMLAQVGGNVYVSRGMQAITTGNWLEESNVVRLMSQSITSPDVWLGIGLLGVFFVLYAAVLSWADLSFVLPATAFGYVLNVACGYYFLHEAVTLSRWLGSLCICLGVVCVSRSTA